MCCRSESARRRLPPGAELQPAAAPAALKVGLGSSGPAAAPSGRPKTGGGEWELLGSKFPGNPLIPQPQCWLLTTCPYPYTLKFLSPVLLGLGVLWKDSQCWCALSRDIVPVLATCEIPYESCGSCALRDHDVAPKRGGLSCSAQPASAAAGA